MKYDKALVTGGAGFIGSHLVKRLVREGLHVSVIDDLSTGRRENLDPSANFYQMDISSADLTHVFASERPQVVFHLAAQASVTLSLSNPAKDALVNVVGSLNIFDMCRKFGVERIIFSSSAAVYGNPETLPCHETHPPHPISPYGVAKYAVELYLKSMAQTQGLKYTVLRYGNVYGPRQDPYGEAGVIAIFTRQMLNNEQPTIFGDGTHERDFIYVDDVVKANLKALEQEENDTFNIGTGQATRIGVLYATLVNCTQYSGRPRHASARPGDVYKMYMDIAKAVSKLDWAPHVDLESGLLKTVQDFRNRFS